VKKRWVDPRSKEWDKQRAAEAMLDGDAYDKKISADNAVLPACLLNLKPNCAKWLIKDPPPIKYVIMSYLQEGEVAQVAGQAGTSKTTWTMQAGVSLAGGVPFFGIKNTITRDYRVLYVMLERTRKSFQRRWRKCVDHIGNGIKADGDRVKFYRTVTANFTAKALAGQTLGLVEWKNQEWVQTPAVDALIAKIIAAGIEVTFFDPLSRLYRGEENGAVQAAIIKVFERIAQVTGCSVVFVHHSGITQRDGVYTGRGSSQLTDNTSETIAFREFKDAARKELGDYKARLRQGEENAAIVQVDHVRAADGPTNSMMQFVRSPETGLLRYITTIGQKDASDTIADLITNNETFHKWAKDRKFTQTQLVKTRTVALGDVSEREAKALFAAAVKTDFREAGERNGYPAYEWKPPSGASKAHHSAPLHQSKKQGEKHVR
jgi:RecA-family ATPase